MWCSVVLCGAVWCSAWCVVQSMLCWVVQCKMCDAVHAVWCSVVLCGAQSAELEARVQRLRAEQSQRDYDRMTNNVRSKVTSHLVTLS